MKNNLGVYYFHQGTNYYAYKLLGSHYQKDATTFRVWAPNAKKIAVVGEFNGWNKTTHLMSKITDEGLWEITIPGVCEYQAYKYAILSRRNRWILKSDPYAYHFEIRPSTASKVYSLEGYEFNDSSWMQKRSCQVNKPMNIYELNLASWRKYEDGNFFNYEKLAYELIDYLKDLSYTHIEIMPINEFPLDASWGYQVTGFFGITSRFGTPKDFMKFVDLMHQANIGVIVDWVPGHFCKDEHGLIDFDGSTLYEPSDKTKKEHLNWGTRCFDYGRCEIQSFLVSSAMYLLEEYHIDGLRVDAVASMLYLNYDREDGKWHLNSEGTNINLEALAFLKKLNEAIHSHYPGVMTIAEESTTFPNLTKKVSEGGVGFDYKWNMGWMNDTLKYLKTDPIYRQYDHHLITFQMTYIYSEKFILALSHDEVVHGKCSLLSKAPGTYEQKFAGVKTYLMYMMSHPGKKLNFMGYEFGQFIEWRDAYELDWLLLQYEQHQQMLEFNKKLNKIYLTNKPFYELDDSWLGFNWINANDDSRNVYSYVRKDASGNEIFVILNFSLSEWHNYKVALPTGDYEVLLASNDISNGGYFDVYNQKYRSINNEMSLNLPAICGIYLRKVKRD